MSRYLIALLFAASVCNAAPPGVGSTAFVKAAKAGMSDQFKDPAAVQFRKLFLASNEGRNVLCGEVNAKNSTGGYVGFRPFYFLDSATVDLQPDGNLTRDFNEGFKRFCGHKLHDVR